LNTFTFNRNPLQFAGTIEQPDNDLIKNTLGLWCASIEDAIRYGGDITREAIGAMNIRNDRKYVVVDTKITMLKPGWCPAIPGWHVDGTPRTTDEGLTYNFFTGKPDIEQQDMMRPARFHLLVTGEGCLTNFVNQRVNIELPNKDARLFQKISKEINEKRNELDILTAPSCQVVEFDWWDIHEGVLATKSEWRYLIRVTETDLLAPETDLRKIIRTQQQVYAELNYGW
jgi:hypothetical protein